MNRRSLAILLTLLCCLPVVAQSKAGKRIIALEHKWMDAMKSRDRATLERLVAPEFTLAGVTMDGDPLPRAVWMDNTMHQLKVTSVAFEKTNVRVYGNTAVVHTLFTWKGTFGDGPPFDDTAVLIDTWIRRNGQWQVVSRFAGDAK